MYRALRICQARATAVAVARIPHRSSSSRSPFVTTPIYYVNSTAHVGHVYSTILADCHYRWQKQNRIAADDDPAPIFCTGTDEHGQKIQQAAEAADTPPLAHCDAISAKFKALFDSCDISYSDYIRTTEPRHRRAVEHFWNVLVDRGHIYKGSFAGWYSVSDECFVPEIQTEVKETETGQTQRIFSESGNPVEWLEEDNYMFRLTAFIPQLRDWYLDNAKVVQPPSAAGYILAMIEGGDITDLSVSRSRSRLQWGIPVPGDDTQTIYVWLDALVNYLTVAGYPDNPDFAKQWPPTVQVMGKDILKFHGVFWPAFLMAAGLQLPERFFAHSHWTMGQKKMSKSRGNVYPADRLVDDFGSVAVRYFFSSSNCLSNEAEFSADRVREKYNDELADILGNLVMRMSSKKCLKELVVPQMEVDLLPRFRGCDTSRQYEWTMGGEEVELKRLTVELLNSLVAFPDLVDEAMTYGRLHTAVYESISLLRYANGLFHNFQPWKLAKSQNAADQRKLAFCVRLCLEASISACTVLRPVILDKADDILTCFLPDEKQWTLQRCHQFIDVLVNGGEDRFAGQPLQRVTVPPFKKFQAEDKQ